MRVIFISLLFSITIGNVLYAMEKSAPRVGAAIIVNIDELDSNTGINVTELLTIGQAQPSTTETITTLAGMQGLAERILNRSQTRGKNANNFPEQEEFEISNDFIIAPQVFYEYANLEKITTEFEPKFLRRIICRRFKGKNKFEHASASLRKRWAKKLLMVFSQPNSQKKATARNRLDEEEDDFLFTGGDVETANNAQVVERSNLLVTRIRSESDDDAVESLKQKLRNANWEKQQLEQKAILYRELNAFFAKQQESEEKADGIKTTIAEIFALAVTSLGVYFGAEASC